MQFTRGWVWQAQDPQALAYRFQGIGKDELARAVRALLKAKAQADFYLSRKVGGSSGPVWGLDPESSTGADWVLAESGDAIALSVVTGEEIAALEKALTRENPGRRNPDLAFHPALATADIDPARTYTIAFPHVAIRAIRTTYGNLPNLEAGSRYTSREFLAELMKGGKAGANEHQ
jgi:hypothetical protein